MKFPNQEKPATRDMIQQITNVVKHFVLTTLHMIYFIIIKLYSSFIQVRYHLEEGESHALLQQDLAPPIDLR